MKSHVAVLIGLLVASGCAGIRPAADAAGIRRPLDTEELGKLPAVRESTKLDRLRHHAFFMATFRQPGGELGTYILPGTRESTSAVLMAWSAQSGTRSDFTEEEARLLAKGVVHLDHHRFRIRESTAGNEDCRFGGRMPNRSGSELSEANLLRSVVGKLEAVDMHGEHPQTVYSFTAGVRWSCPELAALLGRDVLVYLDDYSGRIMVTVSEAAPVSHHEAH